MIQHQKLKIVACAAIVVAVAVGVGGVLKFGHSPQHPGATPYSPPPITMPELGKMFPPPQVPSAGNNGRSPASIDTKAKPMAAPESGHSGHPMAPPQSIANLARMMAPLHEALNSETAAADLLKVYQNCVDHPDQPEFRGVQGICGHNASLLGEKFESLQASAKAITLKAAAVMPKVVPVPASAQNNIPAN